MGIERAEVIARMRGAFRQGMSAGRFIVQMRAEGLSYRRTTMLSDWRSVNQLETKKGLMEFVRKDYRPSVAAIAQVTWKISREYMYVVKVRSRISPDAPITERKVNIMSDNPLTPREVESQVIERWGEWEKYAAEELVGLKSWSAVHRIME